MATKKTTTKPKKVTESFARTWLKETNPVNFDLLKQLIESNKISGYCQKDGLLSNGKSFAQIYLIIEPE